MTDFSTGSTAAPDRDGTLLEAARRRADNLTTIKQSLLQDYPDVRARARIALQERLVQAHYLEVDPDQTWFHVFSGASSSSRTYSGWQHQGPPLQSMTLTDLQLRNFPADFGGDPNGLNANSGVYDEGSAASTFDRHNEVRLLSSELRQAVRDNDFYQSYYSQLEHYYQSRLGALQTVAEASALQYVEANIRRGDATRALGAGTAPATLSGKALGMLSEAAGHAAGGTTSYGTRSYVFDIDSYPSRDMSWLQASDGHVVLLMPGDERPVREFDDLARMRAGLREITRTAAGREQLGRHFSIYNRRDGMTYQGIDKWLRDLASGSYDQRVAYAPQQIAGNVFASQVERMREADLDNVHYLIRSNADVSRQELIQAFGAFNGILGNPLTQVAELGLDLLEIRLAGMGEGRAYATADAWRTSIGLGLSLLVGGMVGVGAEAGPGPGPVTGSASEAGMPHRAGALSPRGSSRLLSDDIPLQTMSFAAEELTEPEGSAPTAEVADAPTIGNAYRNQLGMLERRDIQFLYRAIKSERADQADPARLGFAPSGWFEVPRMTEAPTLVTSSSKQGAIKFGKGMYGTEFRLYQIDSEGLPAASLEENARNNSAALSRHLGYEDEGLVGWWMENDLERNIGENAMDYDEVHLAMKELTPSRIRLIPATEYPATIPSGYISVDDLSTPDVSDVEGDAD